MNFLEYVGVLGMNWRILRELFGSAGRLSTLKIIPFGLACFVDLHDGEASNSGNLNEFR